MIKKSVKVTELKQVKQDYYIMKKYIQMFKWVARGSGYEEKLLIDKFKREMNRRQLICYELIP